jgi:hypothetical protein
MTFPFAGPASAGPASISAATPVSVGTTWQDLGNICSNNYVCNDTIPHHWITDSDPVPTLFFSGFQDANKKYFFLFFCFITYCRYIYISLLI